MVLQKKKILEFVIISAFILLGIGLRLLPHAPNFTPIAAIALFAGVYFSRKIAFILPIAIMLVSDLFFGHYEFFVMASVYISFLLAVGLGIWLKKHKETSFDNSKKVLGWGTRILGTSILAGIIFFLATNFAVWAFTPWYAKTLAGLLQCFILAIPFFKNTLAGNLFYSTAFFGAYGLIHAWLKNKLPAPQPAKA